VLPTQRTRFHDGERVRVPLRPPGPAEVVVEVAGAALGVEPRAEIAGRVIAAGEAAGEWIGRRVVAPRLLPCGDCERCRRGRPATCAARAVRDGLASHDTLPARFLCSLEPPLWPALPEDELWRLAALADAAAAPYGALVQAGLAPGDTLVIVGDGPRARFARLIAHALGARVSGDAPDRAKILEVSGNEDERARAVALCPPGGTLLFLDGGADVPVSLPIEWLIRREAQAHFCGPGHPDLLPELCALAVRHAWPLAELTRRVRPGEEAGAPDPLPILAP
jgi:threonine dehydrogenase-like Zn-dependent dehydrogenase